jgi:hypothetical protein
VDAHREPEVAGYRGRPGVPAHQELVRDALTSTLATLLPQDQMSLITARRARFRRFGADTLVLLDTDPSTPSDRSAGRGTVDGRGQVERTD